MSNDISSTKAALRKKYRRIRESLDPSARHKASESICRQIEASEAFQNAATILTYLPMNSEVDLTHLLRWHLSKQWGIPRIQSRGRMVFHAYDPSKLSRHSFGMLEPDPGCAVIPPEASQLILVPGLAFDLHGWRLGYGGGFYDRLLSNYSGRFMGVSYQALLVDHLPHDDHDVPVPVVVTEMGFHLPSP